MGSDHLRPTRAGHEVKIPEEKSFQKIRYYRRNLHEFQIFYNGFCWFSRFTPPLNLFYYGLSHGHMTRKCFTLKLIHPKAENNRCGSVSRGSVVELIWCYPAVAMETGLSWTIKRFLLILPIISRSPVIFKIKNILSAKKFYLNGPAKEFPVPGFQKCFEVLLTLSIIITSYSINETGSRRGHLRNLAL